MSHDRETRRTLAVLVCVAVMTASGGCRRSPFQRLADGSPGAPKSASTAGDGAVPLELPALASAAEPGPANGQGAWTGSPSTMSWSPANDGGLERVLAPPARPLRNPAPTPMLDAALKRVEAQEQIQRQATVASRSEPSPPAVAAPKVQAVSMVMPPRPRDPGPLSSAPAQQRQAGPEAPKPEAKPVSRKEGTPRGAAGETDLVAAPPTSEPAAKPVDPAAAWAESLDRLKAIARESARQPGAGEGTSSWLVRAQVVEWLAGEASRPANQAILRKAVASMADATTTPSADAAARSAEIRSAVLALEDRVPFGIADLRLCREVLGFGAFEPLEGPALKPAQPVILYCELAGLRYQTVDQSFVSRLSSRVELVSAKDGARAWDQALGEAEDRCQSRRRDFYVNYRISIPATVAPGDYRLRLTQTDLLAHQTASAEVPVTIAK